MLALGSCDLVTNFTFYYNSLRYFNLKLRAVKAAKDHLHTVDDYLKKLQFCRVDSLLLINKNNAKN